MFLLTRSFSTFHDYIKRLYHCGKAKIAGFQLCIFGCRFFEPDGPLSLPVFQDPIAVTPSIAGATPFRTVKRMLPSHGLRMPTLRTAERRARLARPFAVPAFP